jgi:hypothetical protein
LTPGTVLDATAVRVARVHADRNVLAPLFVVERAGAITGNVIVRSMRAGSLIGRADVRSTADGAARRVMSFPLARSHAVDGHLGTGDRVDVIAVDHDSGHARYVLTGAEVAAVEAHVSGPLAGATDDVTITVVVNSVTAPRLAAAIDRDAVTLVRATGAGDASVDVDRARVP